MRDFGVRLARRAYSDPLLRTSVGLFTAFVISGFANYGYQVAMGRLLPPNEFGLLNTLLGVFVVLSVPVATLMMVISRRTAEYYAGGRLAEVRALFQRINLQAGKWGVIGLGVWGICSGILADYLRTPSLTPILLLGLCILLAVMVPINSGILQGLQDYRRFTFLQALGGPLRFFLCVTPVFLGYGVNGALVGLLMTTASTWMLAWLFVRPHLEGGRGEAIYEPLAWRDSLPVMVANLAFALITQMDLILVNRLFSPTDASRYAAAAVLGRAVIYVPGTIVMALFPMVSEKKALKVDARPLLTKAIVLTLALSGAGAAVFLVAPEGVLSLLFGSRYLESAGLLRYFGLAMLPLALLTILFQYSLAHGQSYFAWIMLAGAIFEFVLLGFFHSTLTAVLLTVGATGAGLCLVGFLNLRSVHVSTGVYAYECA